MKEDIQNIFENFIKEYDLSNHKLSWKYIHSYRVASAMEEYAKYFNFNDKDILLSYTIGLFHDIGRFYQLDKYDSYNDIKTIDHGTLGYNIIKDKKLFKDIFDEDTINLISYCIDNHNKRSINLVDNERYVLFAKLIRDCDKLDILRAISEGNIEVISDDSSISKKIDKEFINKTLIDRKDITNKSEYNVSIFAFVYDLYFSYTKNLLVKDNIINKIYDRLNNTKYKKYKDIVNNYLKEGT